MRTRLSDSLADKNERLGEALESLERAGQVGRTPDWIRRREERKPAEQTRLDAIRATSGELRNVLDLAYEFATLIRRQSQGTLSDWLARAEVSVCPEVRRFTEGIHRDEPDD